MSRRSTRTTTVVTSTVQPRKDVNFDSTLLREDDFEKRNKTDYTYSRSATYSSKYVDGSVTSPNLSRRRLYTADMSRDNQSSSDLMKTSSSQVKVYTRDKGKHSSGLTESNRNVNNSAENYSLAGQSSRTNTTQHIIYTSSAHEQADESLLSAQQTNNSSEAVFSEDEEVMSRSVSSRRKTARNVRGRSKSPKRGTRTTSGARRKTVRLQDDVDSESSSSLGVTRAALSRKQTYNISNGLDTEESDNTLRRVTNNNTRYNAGDMITERSSTIIDTVTTGTPVTAKLMGCFLFIYGCTRILFSRLWYNFGHPIYSTLQRYLLLDSWMLSRSLLRNCRALLLGLFLLLLPLTLLALAVCGSHALGFVNMPMCGPLTNVYYVTKHSDVNTPWFSSSLRNMLHGMFKTAEKQQTPAKLPPLDSTSTINWENVIDTRLAALKTSIELQSNSEISKQRQKNTDLETAIQVLNRDVADIKGTMASLTAVIAELQELKLKVSQLGVRVDKVPDYSESIAKLHADLAALKVKLGEVKLQDDSSVESDVLTYLYSELNTLASSMAYVLGLGHLPKLKVAVNRQENQAPPPKDCPGSSCVCESDMVLRLSRLHDDILKELEQSGSTGPKIFFRSDNSSGLSEQMVLEMIRSQLEIYAADKTGMPDFALQSMGAQVVSTRCSQTYNQETGLMTFFGVNLYHLQKDPSIVIQPEVNPGECWCFHGQSGSLVIEMADKVKFNSFSIEHISATQSATGEILSAPKDIEVYGLRSELDTQGQKVGKWRYEMNGPRLQFFPVQDSSISPYHVVELRVLSNWGQKEFTCLYRFRVHGKLAAK